jgi:2-phosphoglycerate kinase
LKVYPGSWSVTVVCGASGTGRTRFAYALAARYNGHVIDTADVLEAVRAMTSPDQHPELFYRDAEDWRGSGQSKQPMTGTPGALAAARLQAADALTPAVKAVAEQPRLRLNGRYEYPHTVVTGRHALPALAWDFAVILTETEEQIRANLAARYRQDASVDLRVQTSMLVQEELLRRGHEHNKTRCEVISTDARPWPDAVERAYGKMSDRWDYRNALGSSW